MFIRHCERDLLTKRSPSIVRSALGSSPNGLGNSSQQAQSAPSIHKTIVDAPHMRTAEPDHPMDISQNSKSPINFAPNPAQVAVPTHDAPARPVAAAANGNKSTGQSSTQSSPRYENGDSIDLPEIPTDSEDMDSEHEVAIPDWANSLALLTQETTDPVSVFGHPGEFNLEEAFKGSECRGSAQATSLVRLHQQLIVL
jgi:hypothetical protein